jgi:hypothetical protein
MWYIGLGISVYLKKKKATLYLRDWHDVADFYFPACTRIELRYTVEPVNFVLASSTRPLKRNFPFGRQQQAPHCSFGRPPFVLLSSRAIVDRRAPSLPSVTAGYLLYRSLRYSGRDRFPASLNQPKRKGNGDKRFLKRL